MPFLSVPSVLSNSVVDLHRMLLFGEIAPDKHTDVYPLELLGLLVAIVLVVAPDCGWDYGLSYLETDGQHSICKVVRLRIA